MARQMSFGETEYSKGMNKNRKGQILEQMEKIVPWMTLVKIIAPYYAKEPEKAGRRPYPLFVMIRIHQKNVSTKFDIFIFRFLRTYMDTTNKSER